jgi:hypothetical protein
MDIGGSWPLSSGFGGAVLPEFGNPRRPVRCDICRWPMPEGATGETVLLVRHDGSAWQPNEHPSGIHNRWRCELCRRRLGEVR